MGQWFSRLLAAMVAAFVPVTAGLPPAPAVTVRPAVSPPAAVAPAAAPPAMDALAVAVVDLASGAVLYRREGVAPHPLASITKLMTALVAIDRKPNWEALVTLRAEDVRSGGRVILSVGDQVSVRDLFEVMLVASSNEAAVALARSSGLTPQAFVAAMNKKAKALGLADTRFVDPAGLEPGNVAHAADAAKLVRAAFSDPMISAAVQLSGYRLTIRNTGRRVTAESTNILLQQGRKNGNPLPVGGKTGYLDESGYNVALIFEQAGHQVSVAVLGAPSADARFQDAVQLAAWTFSSFRWPALGG
ncbi:MAG: D-alanyl-D-alanine endopeptidase (penicillin-binding protein 7) [Parcubacteria group bacterium Gr01-1014_31]|nr:MAG: D-alanyl-D-alanine endopeptidase (penicillin-binding protein 7) [Parcubacteria group bacterium Gr01-1014_31]